MIFTGSRRAPSFLIYMIFTGYRQPPFFTIYMIFAGYQQPPFSIYMVFTGSRQPPFFNLRGIYNVIYRTLAVTLFQFTWSLQDLRRLPLINLHVIYMICVLLPYYIYSIFQMFQCRNLHDIYSIFWEHVKVQKSCKFTFYPFACYLHVIYTVCKFSTFPVINIMYAEFCHGNGELALTEEQNFLTSATILAQDLALMLCHYFHCNCSVNFRVIFYCYT